jgi:hypothetical protein
MMSMQARESIPRHFRASRSLRPYPLNSARAKARLLVLAMIADGRIDAAELDGLMKRDAFAELGITRNDFLEVLYEFGADLAGLPTSGFEVAISPQVVSSLLAEISDDSEKLAMLRLIFDVIRSDGELAPAEARRTPSSRACTPRRTASSRNARRRAFDASPGSPTART